MNQYLIIRKKHNKSLINIDKIYTFFLIVSPILFLYGVGLGTITLSDTILIILNIILLFRGLIYGKINVYLNLLPFLIYIIILMLFNMLFNEFDSEVLMRTLRYMFYLINIIFYVKDHFNYTFGVKVYRVVSLISTGFLFIQILVYKLVGVYIPGVILSANLTASDLYNYNIVLQQAQFKRFMSFFEEPSHFAIYILGYITILLFSKTNDGRITKKNVLEICFLSVGIALSTSILGVMVLGAMLSIWLGTNLFRKKRNHFKLILFIFVFFIAVILVSQTNAFEYFTNTSIINKQASGRFDGYKLLNEWNTDIKLNVFGRGMVKNNYGIFLASYPLLIYYFGYIGFILFIMAFIPYFIKHKLNVSTALLICLFGISIGSEILLGRFILVFLPLIINEGNNKMMRKNVKI